MKPLWVPSLSRVQQSNFQKYFRFLRETYGLSFSDYESLYDWSVQDIPRFWESIWRFCEVKASPFKEVMGPARMPGTEWFKGSLLSFSENLLRYRDDREALVGIGEDQTPIRLTYRQLYQAVARCAQGLKQAGVQKGDRVAAFVPNIPQVVIAMLATNSVGAIWSSCSPDFGIQGVLDRFGQIKPKILITANGYTYHGKHFNSLEKVSGILRALPSVKKTVVIPYEPFHLDLSSLSAAVGWDDFCAHDATDIDFELLPFDYPLYIMYSSGTTGVPKCIVHGQGGTLLQHLKELVLHTDLKREDRICYLTTCGWMMWNWLVSSLAVGATVVLAEGNPGYPDMLSRWRMVDEEKISIFGLSPKFLSFCEKAQINPKEISDFAHLKTILSTGSPLSAQNFTWVYQHVKQDLQVSSICGGTDIISCFMLGNPLLSVYSEQIQCRGLGMKVEAYNDKGVSVIGEKGELVCTAPFPSMPISFWDDPKGEKYYHAYFDTYKNVWRHGDFIEITKQGGVIVYGRSDATLNPGGVRIGTAEIYRQLEAMPEIKDSIVTGQRWKEDTRVVLFIVLAPGIVMSDALVKQIKARIREGASPRHVPEKILEVKDIPYTISGKKVEMAVTKVIHGEFVENEDALANPHSLEQFKDRVELES